MLHKKIFWLTETLAKKYRLKKKKFWKKKTNPSFSCDFLTSLHYSTNLLFFIFACVCSGRNGWWWCKYCSCCSTCAMHVIVFCGYASLVELFFLFNDPLSSHLILNDSLELVIPPYLFVSLFLKHISHGLGRSGWRERTFSLFYWKAMQTSQVLLVHSILCLGFHPFVFKFPCCCCLLCFFLLLPC